MTLDTPPAWLIYGAIGALIALLGIAILPRTRLGCILCAAQIAFGGVLLIIAVVGVLR